ncbi:hypothetical protein CJ030_MR2G012903 [Morella rubra]|uniref:Uncharacterized protein n=1 Tax=Morella rubra TaxID=262757 RepID=A0A6A1WJE0_9ROSI|nr:hypothetical protein CJ030_MR2G012903 [Morella rubra]
MTEDLQHDDKEVQNLKARLQAHNSMDLIHLHQSEDVVDQLRDQECVKHQMHEAFKSYKCKLHRIYKKFRTSKIARTNPPDEVDIKTWLKLCTQWEDDDYKALSKKNATNRSKLVINHTARSKSLHRLCEEKRDEDSAVIEFYKELTPTRTVVG